jgi:hypothetical protein
MCFGMHRLKGGRHTHPMRLTLKLCCSSVAALLHRLRGGRHTHPMRLTLKHATQHIKHALLRFTKLYLGGVSRRQVRVPTSSFSYSTLCFEFSVLIDPADEDNVCGTQFTSFTSTKVQILCRVCSLTNNAMLNVRFSVYSLTLGNFLPTAQRIFRKKGALLDV